jgi:predicted ester cyclase
MATDTANNEKIVQRAVEAFEAADERAMREDLAPDFVSHSAPPGFADDADGFVQLAKHLKAGMPDGKFTINDMFASGDKVAVRLPTPARIKGNSLVCPRATGP